VPPIDHRTLPNPSNFELEVLGVLWRRGPLTVRDVHDEIAAIRDVGYTSVLKTMQIMAEKGLVRRDESARAHVYHAVDEDEVKQRLVTDLLDRAFAGSAAELVVRALDARRASPEDLERIRKLLVKQRAKTR
jgi:predicted transcriptional regulator